LLRLQRLKLRNHRKRRRKKQSKESEVTYFEQTTLLTCTHRKLNLLSFGEEGAQEFEPSEEIIQQKKKNNTSQDLLEVQEDVEAPNVDRKKASLSEAKEKIGRISKERSEPSHHDLEKKEADSFDQQMREKVRMSREKDTSEAVSHDPAK
jgi:hypothetical protein